MGWTDFGWEDDPSRATPVDAEQLEAAGEHAYDKAVADAATAASAALTAHTGDTTAAHAGSAISFTPTGTIASTDVQAAVAEVASERVAADAALDVRVTSLESGQSGSGSTQVYVQSSAPAQGNTAWVWFKPSTGTTVYYAPSGPTAPSFDVNPAITGTALVGSTLTCDGGMTSGNPSATPTYLWKRDGSPLSATASTYVLVSGDVGHAITCTVTASNGVGSPAVATSNAITPAVPVNTVAPAITGSAITGQTLTVGNGTWTSAGSPIYTRQWQHDLGSGFVNIAGATGTTYGPLASGDESHPLKCVVTATDANGPASHDSNTVTPSASATAPGQPTGLTLTPGDTQIAASWTAPASNGGSAITTYLVEVRQPAGSGSYATFTHSPSTTPSITITGLIDGTTCGVRVSAVNAIGTGTATSEAVATPVSATFSESTVSGLQVWLKADAITGHIDGDALASWPGSTATTRDAAQATTAAKPLYKTNIINSLPVVRFDGTDDSMMVDTASAWLTANEATVFVVAIARGTVAALAVLIPEGTVDDYATPTGFMVGFQTGGNEVLYRNTAARAPITGVAGTGTPFIEVVKFTTTTGQFTDAAARRITNGAVANDSPDAAQSTINLNVDQLILGRRWESSALGGASQLDYAEVLVYTGSLSSGNQTTVENYLKTKHGIA